MKVSAETTISELMKKFPEGFSIGPGTPEHPGELAKIVFATSHFFQIASEYSMLGGNRGYLIVDMD